MSNKKRKVLIGVMGPAESASEEDLSVAFKLGQLIAKEGWVLLSGAVNAGVMAAVNKGAKEADGLTVGIIPHLTTDIAEGVDIHIMTDIGGARNNINALSSDVLVACGMSPGTASEVSLALHRSAQKPVILINSDKVTKQFFVNIGKSLVHIADSPQDVIDKIKKLLE